MRCRLPCFESSITTRHMELDLTECFTGSACRMATRVTKLAATFTTTTTWVMISTGCGSIDNYSTRARITNSLH